MNARYDELDGFWEVVDEEGGVIAGPFAGEQDALDYIDSFEDFYG